LSRPWQILAAGGAISCGERANVLRRQPKDLNFWAFGVALQAENVCLSKLQRYKKNG